jgi:hypothetical protein
MRGNSARQAQKKGRWGNVSVLTPPKLWTAWRCSVDAGGCCQPKIHKNYALSVARTVLDKLAVSPQRAE